MPRIHSKHFCVLSILVPGDTLGITCGAMKRLSSFKYSENESERIIQYNAGSRSAAQSRKMKRRMILAGSPTVRIGGLVRTSSSSSTSLDNGLLHRRCTRLSVACLRTA